MSNSFHFGVLASALSPEVGEAARLAREAGFRGLLFDAVSPGVDLTELSQTGQRDFRRIVNQQDQKIIGLSVSAGSEGFSLKADVDRVLARLEQIFTAAVGLQSPLICLELGPVPAAATPAKISKPVSADEAGIILLPEPAAAPAPPPPPAKVDLVATVHFDGALKELAHRADRIGVMLALRSDLANFAALARAIETADCPWFGVDLDPVALLQDDWPADDIFSRLGSHIRHVRARDAQASPQGRTRPVGIGRGATDWQRLLSQLTDCGYHDWVTVDSMELTDRRGAALAGVKHLKAELARAEA